MKPSRRASNMARSLECPGSSTILPLIKQRQRDDGDEGTWLHHAVASRAIEELGATPPEGGLPPPRVPAGYKPPTQSLWMVDWCIRHLRETIPADWALMVEIQFQYEFDRWICTGQGDVIAQSPDGKKIKGKDWKFVYKPITPAPENDQFLTYLVLAYLDWPDTEEVEFEAVCPRLSGEDRLTSVTVSGADLDRCVRSLDERQCKALDKPMLLKTSLKACEWCIGCACPAIQELNKKMEYELTPEKLAALKREPDDATLADFVIDGHTLRKPIEDATEMLHERIDANPSIQAGCGLTVTRKIQKGDYTIPDPLAFMSAVRVMLPEDEQIARVFTPQMGAIKDEIAKKMDIPKTSKNGVSAESVFDGHLRPLVEQGIKRVLEFR